MYGQPAVHLPEISMARKREQRTERIELRVVPSVRKIIQRATAISGLAAGDLAYEGARRILEQHESLVLGSADREAFLKALTNPAPPTERLLRALRRHRVLAGWSARATGDDSFRTVE